MKTSFISRLFAALALLLISGISARAVTVDFAGKIFKPGGSVSASSTDAVATSLIYAVDISATGSSTGSFIPIFGTGDLEAAMTAIAPGSQYLLHCDLGDLTGKFPMTLGQQEGEYTDVTVPTMSGTFQFAARGHVSLAINKKGIVTAKVTGLGYSETTLVNNKNKAVKFTGTYAISSGEVSVTPLLATSSSAQPIVIAMLNTHFALTATYGEENVYPGNTGMAFLARGASTTQFFVLQNNGPATDTLTVASSPFATGASAKYYDGTKNVTAQVTGAGYPITMTSGEQKLLKVVEHVAPNIAKFSDPVIGFKLSSTTDPTAVVYGGTQIFLH